MTVAVTQPEPFSGSWIRTKMWAAVVHTYVLSGALVGIATGIVRTVYHFKYDKESLTVLVKGTGQSGAPESQPLEVPEQTAPAPLARVHSHRIRFSEDGDRNSFSFDEIPAIKEDKVDKMGDAIFALQPSADDTAAQTSLVDTVEKRKFKLPFNRIRDVLRRLPAEE